MRVALRESFRAARIKDEVIALGTEALGLVPERLSGLVDHSVCAKLAHILNFMAGSHNAGHLQVMQLAKLNKCRAHPATGGMNKHPHAGSNRHVLQQSVICGE